MKRSTTAAILLICLIVIAASAFAAKSKPETKGVLTVVWAGDGVRIEASFKCDWALVSVTGDHIVLWGNGKRPADFSAAVKAKSGCRTGWASATFVANDGR